MADDPRPPFNPWWTRCIQTNCRGAQAIGQQCLMHATDLSALGPGADLDLRGVVIDSVNLVEIRRRFLDHESERVVFGDVQCDFTLFTGRAWFDKTDINGSASFRNTQFGYLARFDDVTCAGLMSFRDARFPGKALMPSLRAERIGLVRTWFASRVEIDTHARELNCMDARFEGGMVLATDGVVDATGAYFGAPSRIAGAKVLSLAGGDASNLVLAETDLSECRFVGAHRLELLRIDGRTRFASPVGWWRARRRMLFEEGRVNPARLAAVYRALRKSLEDSKFEAGAGDLYYGEMECRRHSTASSGAERMILWFYWLLSGYGQRASRALIALVLVIAVVTGLLTVWGQDFGMAARTALGAVVFRDDKTELTATGEWVVLVARFLGPVLLALAVLAIRARVKR
jgi:hypothetical protein